MKLQLFVLGFTLLACVPQSYANRTDQADAILSAFGPGCPTRGTCTDLALSSTRTVIKILESIQNDPDCKSAPGIIAEAQSIQERLNGLQKNPDEAKLLGLRRTSELILLQIGMEQDQTRREAMLSDLHQLELEIAGLTGELQYDADFNSTNRLGNSLQSLVSGTKTLLQQVHANQRCFQKNSLRR